MDISYSSMILQVLGGLGLFLLGMVVMTDGLRALAGDTMRYILMRFTHTPLSGVMTGAVTTAVLQSSSATTVAAVGFVGAGLMGFSESLGIIFGANIGTTLKGWLIALIGFRFQIGTALLPLIFLGALMRLFNRGKLGSAGYAIAGFGLIFVGIDLLQTGMTGIDRIVAPDSFPADSWFGRIQLVLLGILITVITQSSSAGVATALTALFAGAINFPQAAALVIGMDMGTTVTAAMATIGGSTSVRRTGFSHVIYNCFTGIGAVLLISPYIYLWEQAGPQALQENAEIALVAFHSGFNLLGVIVVLPFTHAFARFMERLIPEKYPLYAKRLDKALLSEPGIALLTAQTVIQDELVALFKHSRAIMYGESWKRIDMSELRRSIEQASSYLENIHITDTSDIKSVQLIELLHTMDHMQRLFERCEEEEDRIIVARESKLFIEQIELVMSMIKQVLEFIELGNWTNARKISSDVYEEMQKSETMNRKIIIEKMGHGEIDLQTGTQYLESLRWLTRVCRHIMQITTHFGNAVVAVAR
jgi:phosphate:Na+ symporter